MHHDACLSNAMLSINEIVYALFDAMARCQLCGMFVHGFTL